MYACPAESTELVKSAAFLNGSEPKIWYLKRGIAFISFVLIGCFCLITARPACGPTNANYFLFLDLWRTHMLRPSVLSFLALVTLMAPQSYPQSSAGGVDQVFFNGLHYRLVGPSRGGRVTTVTGVPSQPKTFYMG